MHPGDKNRHLGLFQKNENTQNKHAKCLETLTTIIQKGLFIVWKTKRVQLEQVSCHFKGQNMAALQLPSTL